MKIKMTITIIVTVVLSILTYARPPMARSMHHHTPPPHPIHHHHHRHHNGAFWIGAGVGLVGSTLVNPPSITPIAIGPTIGRVWVPPIYEIRPVYDQFGNILRYEQVMVSAGYWRY